MKILFFDSPAFAKQDMIDAFEDMNIACDLFFHEEYNDRQSTFFLMRQIIFRLGKQIILTDVAVKIFPNGKKILKFRLVIGEAETAAGKYIKNAKRQCRPDGFCGNVQIDLTVGENQGHLGHAIYRK